MIYNSLNRTQQIDAKIKQGYVKGYRMPFKCLDDLYSMKMGCVTYIVGHEHSGKTEFCLERDIWMAKEYNLSTLIFTPETGDVDDIFLEIGHKWCGKPLIGSYKIDEAQRIKVLQEISQYFHVVEVQDTNQSITLESLFHDCLEYEQQQGVKIDSIVVDPFNELEVNYNGLPRDEWLQKELGRVRRMARQYNKHVTIVTHPRETERLHHKDGYLLPPSRKDYAGGQAWARKGESMICIYRPPEGLQDNGVFNEGNLCQFIMQKAKPKGIGKTGDANIFFDWKRSAYYEFSDGNKWYAGELYQKEFIENNQDPINQIQIDEEPPF